MDVAARPTSRDSAPARRREDVWTTVGVWVAALGVILWGSWRPAWSGDEAATITVIRRPFSEVVQSFTFDSALAPYYVLLKLWSQVSMTPFWLRLPSALAMATAVALLYRLVRKLADRELALFAAAVMIIMPVTTRFGHDVRPFAFAVLACVFTALCWSRFMQRGGWQDGVGVTVGLVFGGLMQAFSILLVGALLIASFAAPIGSRRSDLRRTGVVCIAALAILSPYLLYIARNASGQPDPPAVSAINVIATTAGLPVAVTTPPLALVFAGIVLVLACLGFVLGWMQEGSRRSLAVLAAAWFLLAPLVLVGFQALTGSPGLITRYWVYTVPALAAGAAVPLAFLRSKSTAIGLSALLVVTALALPTQVYLRSADAHHGERWQQLQAVLAMPGLSGLPLVTRDWNYRGLVANDSTAARRMPLANDPVAERRINPTFAEPGSLQFEQFLDTQSAVIAYKRREDTLQVPTQQSLAKGEPVLEKFTEPVLLCSFHGDGLGVLARSGAEPFADPAEVALQIEALSPENITCSTPEPK